MQAFKMFDLPSLSHLYHHPSLSHLYRHPSLSHLYHRPSLSHLYRHPSLSHLYRHEFTASIMFYELGLSYDLITVLLHLILHLPLIFHLSHSLLFRLYLTCLIVFATLLYLLFLLIYAPKELILHAMAQLFSPPFLFREFFSLLYVK